VFLTARRSAGTLELDLTGPWRIGHFAEIDRELSQTQLEGAQELIVSAAHLEALDLSSSWILSEYLQRARRGGAQVHFRGQLPDQLRLVESLDIPPPASQHTEELAELLLEEPVEALGRRVVRGWHDLAAGLAFVGRLTVTGVRVIASGRLPATAVARHVYETGVTAIPIVALIAFLISVVIAYMGAQQLLRFGAAVFVVDLVTIGVLRELAVLLTAIIVAGRSGSAFAAEIGAMRLNDEVDALQAMGIDPYEALLLPRLAGLTVALPLLTIIADVIGLAGGALLCRFLLAIPLTQYMARVHDAIAPTTFWVGLIKAPVFAILIGLAGTYRGMQVRDSSRELGRLTTVAVVESLFLVILADALFAVFFLELDI
jgi:phospholipid/cholesterol/gamma-HCH transport system permease protein